MSWISLTTMSQESAVQFGYPDFEYLSVKPWIVIGNEAILSTTNVHSGKRALELGSGTSVQTQVKLQPLSNYKLSGWLRTASGSDEVRLSVNGLGEHNTSVASALAGWKKVDLKFVTGTGQASASIEICNPENTAKNKAWADDLNIEYLGKYTPEKVAGIKPLTQRVPKSDLGIQQQPNSKMDWLLEARFGMFIHWGLFSGPGKGEWYMENKSRAL
jgi:alpha-L-fucosidase